MEELKWPFMLNGRPVRIGDILSYSYKGEHFDGKVYKMELSAETFFVFIKHSSGVSAHNISSNYLMWPDEIPPKKKVAKWAYPVVGILGFTTVGFSEEMTEDEAKSKLGLGIRMLPGTEKEIP